MNTNANQNTTTDADAAALNAQADALRQQADQLTDRAATLSRENDRAAAAPSMAISGATGSSFARTTKRVLGWTLGVGVVALAGTYIYSRLRSAGVDVPTGEDIGNTVASAVDAATA